MKMIADKVLGDDEKGGPASIAMGMSGGAMSAALAQVAAANIGGEMMDMAKTMTHSDGAGSQSLPGAGSGRGNGGIVV